MLCSVFLIPISQFDVFLYNTNIYLAAPHFFGLGKCMFQKLFSNVIMPVFFQHTQIIQFTFSAVLL